MYEEAGVLSKVRLTFILSRDPSHSNVNRGPRRGPMRLLSLPKRRCCAATTRRGCAAPRGGCVPTWPGHPGVSSGVHSGARHQNAAGTPSLAPDGNPVPGLAKRGATGRDNLTSGRPPALSVRGAQRGHQVEGGSPTLRHRRCLRFRLVAVTPRDEKLLQLVGAIVAGGGLQQLKLRGRGQRSGASPGPRVELWGAGSGGRWRWRHERQPTASSRAVGCC